MKKIIFSLIVMLTMTVSAKAMSYEQARNEALFLTDKMAYELNLTDAQYEAAYEINLDYLMSVSSRHDVFGSYWERRNLDLQYILYSWQWDMFRAASYFFRPLYWEAGYWHFGIYARYPHRSYFYFGRPHFYTSYRGAHSWRMNGGRSYYEHHRDHFRPDLHRDSHVGMRDGWNRGDYRGSHSTGSSTRITGRHDHNTERHSGSRLGNEAPRGNSSGYRGNSGSDNRDNRGSDYRGNNGSDNRNNSGSDYRGNNNSNTNTHHPSSNTQHPTPSVGRATTPRISSSASSSAAAPRSQSVTPSRSGSAMSGSRSATLHSGASMQRSGAVHSGATRGGNRGDNGGGSSRRR